MALSLITGGAGFIGSHLARALLRRGPVRILDNFQTGHRENLAGLPVELVEGSVEDPAAVEAAVRGADTVFHLAALVSVAESMERPRDCLRVNVEGTLQVLQACSRLGVRRFLLASSAAVYGDDPTQPKTEDLRPAPRSPYAISKLAGEHLADLFGQTGPLRTVSARFFNVFGPGQDPNGPYAAAVPRFLEKARAGQPLTIHGDGGQTRDFIFVEDLVDALRHLADHPEVTGPVNLGYGASLSILDLARRLLELTGSASPILHGPGRPGDLRHSLAGVDRLRATGWSPAVGLAEGLARTARTLA